MLAVAIPERMVLALIVLLPFFFYPVTLAGFSLFLAVPAFGFVAIVLLTRHRPTLGMLRQDLPVLAFGLLLAAAVLTSTLSIDPLTTFSRVSYIVLFGLVAFAISASIAAGRLTRETVAKALLISGALAGIAIIIQFLAQFAVGDGSVLDWLFDVRALFAGERAAVAEKSNWIVDNLDVVRGVFPFMTPASAGQYLMFCLVAGFWLRGERRAATGIGSGLLLALLVIVTVALLLTLSRQSWLGAGVGIMALSLGKRPLWMLAVMLQLIIVVTLVPIPGVGSSFGDYLLSASDTKTESSQTRIGLWEESIKLIPEHAVIGSGPGTIGMLGGGNSDRPFYAHNVFLDAAVELGIFGVLALMAVFLAGLRLAMRNESSVAFAMLAAMIVASLFDDALYFPRNGLALAVAFGLIAVTRTDTGRGAAELPGDKTAAPAPAPGAAPTPSRA
jgi:O-antigen ligase